jgi:hypothetical protein
MRATASAILVAATVGFGALPSAGADPGAARLAVVVTDRSGVSNDVSLVVAKALEEALVADDLEIVPWADNLDKVPNLDARCAQDAGCIRATGSALGVSDLMLISLAAQGDSVVVNLTWADATTGSAIPRPSITINHINEARTQFEEIEGGLIPKPAAPAAAEATNTTTAAPSLGVPFWVSASVGGAALFTAGALGLYTRTRHQRCADDRDAGWPCAESELDSIDRAAIIGDVFLVTSLAALTTATVLFVLHKEPSESPSLGVSPTRGGTSVSFTTRF